MRSAQPGPKRGTLQSARSYARSLPIFRMPVTPLAMKSGNTLTYSFSECACLSRRRGIRYLPRPSMGCASAGTKVVLLLPTAEILQL